MGQVHVWILTYYLHGNGWCDSIASMFIGTSTSEVNNGSVVMFSSYLVLDGFGEALPPHPLLFHRLFKKNSAPTECKRKSREINRTSVPPFLSQ